MCTTNDVSALIEELQYTWVRARAWTPTTSAARSSSPIWPTRRSHAGRRSRQPAVAAGARAVFGFPLDRRRRPSRRPQPVPGPPRAAHRRPARRRPGRWPAWRPGRSSGCRPTRRPTRSAPSWRSGTNFQFVVHQAAGMVSVQLGVSVDRGADPAARPRLRHRPLARRRRQGRGRPATALRSRRRRAQPVNG